MYEKQKIVILNDQSTKSLNVHQRIVYWIKHNHVRKFITVLIIRMTKETIT